MLRLCIGTKSKPGCNKKKDVETEFSNSYKNICNECIGKSKRANYRKVTNYFAEANKLVTMRW